MKKYLAILLIIIASLKSYSAFSEEYSGKLISLNFTDVDVLKVLSMISILSEKGLILPDSNLGKTSLYVENTHWDKVLYGISKSQGFSYEVLNELIIISNRSCIN